MSSLMRFPRDEVKNIFFVKSILSKNVFVLAELRCSRFIIDIGFFLSSSSKNDLAHKYTSFLAFAQVVVNLYTCFPEY